MRSVTLAAGGIFLKVSLRVKMKLTRSFRRWRSGRSVEESPFNNALLARKLLTLSTISFIKALFGGRFFRITWKVKSPALDSSDKLQYFDFQGKENKSSR